MTTKNIMLAALIVFSSSSIFAQEAKPIVNPAIDMPTYLKVDRKRHSIAKPIASRKQNSSR